MLSYCNNDAQTLCGQDNNESMRSLSCSASGCNSCAWFVEAVFSWVEFPTKTDLLLFVVFAVNGSRTRCHLFPCPCFFLSRNKGRFTKIARSSVQPSQTGERALTKCCTGPVLSNLLISFPLPRKIFFSWVVWDQNLDLIEIFISARVSRKKEVSHLGHRGNFHSKKNTSSFWSIKKLVSHFEGCIANLKQFG